MANMAGFTFDRAKVGQILKEIERQKKTKKDFVGSSKHLSVVEADKQIALKINLGGKGKRAKPELFSFTRTGRTQMANTLRIPMTLWDRMESDDRHRDKLADLASHFLEREPADHMIRTLDGNARAVLSPRYRTLDNADLFFVAAEEFDKAGAEIWDARLYDDGFRLYAVQPGMTARVDDDSDGNKFEAGGEHIAAISISNSETGRGKLKIRPATLVKVCANWNVWDESLSQIHLGRKQEEEGWVSEETERLEDKLIWAKVRDVIKTAFNKEKFEEVIARLRGAKKDAIDDPVKAVEAAVELTDLPESSIDRIRAKFIQDKDFTRYGLIQAVTYQTHDVGGDEEKDMFDDAGAKLLATELVDLMG